MKKIICLITLLLVSFIMYGCKEKPEYIDIKFEDTQFKLLTTFQYDKKYEYIFTYTNPEENEYAEMKMSSNKLNIIVDFAYDELTKHQYNINKESVSNYDNFKEYKYNGYDSYTFSTDEDNLYSLIIFGNSEEKNNPALYLRFSLLNAGADTNLYEVYNGDEFQSFIKSIKFQKLS